MEEAQLLRIGFDSRLDYVGASLSSLTRGLAVIGQSGCGKSFFMGRLVEEISRCSRQCRVLILDSNSDFFAGLSPVDAREFRKRMRKSIGVTRSSSTTAKKRYRLEERDYQILKESDDVVHAQVFGTAAEPFHLSWEIVTKSVWSFIQLVRANDVPPGYVWALGELMQQFGPDDYTSPEKTRRAIVRLGATLTTTHPHLTPVLDEILVDIHREAGVGKWRESPSQVGLPERMFASSRINVLNLEALDKQWRLQAVHAVLNNLYNAQRDKTNAARKLLAVSKARHKDAIRQLGHTFIVVDEAQWYAPALALSAHERAVGELLQALAAEGRKYGIHLILATQRPSKIRQGLLGECDNAVVMKMNSKSDLEHLAGQMRILDVKLLEPCMHFQGVGNAVLAGEASGDAPNVRRFRVAPRRSVEGGADIPLQ